MSRTRIPFGALEAVFLDAGNTLVELDFALLAAELARLGVGAQLAALRRAEAAARPHVSRRIEAGTSTEAGGLFRFWLERMLAGALDLPEGERADLAAALLPRLRAPGMNRRLWSAVLPGVPESLALLREADLSLVVVSNSDGSIEAGLADAGLRPLLDAVVDSRVVGYEKPHPGIFRHALELAGSDPARTLHVGDLYAADVIGARGAGIHPLLLDPYGDWTNVDCAVLPDLPSLAREIAGG